MNLTITRMRVAENNSDEVSTNSSLSGIDLSGKELICQLRDIAGDLEALNGKTENEFLSIGSNLNDFQSRVGEISNVASSTAELILGKEVARATDDFRDIQGRVNNYLTRVEKEMWGGKKKLHNILDMISRINKPLKDLKEIAGSLHMLAMSTRIITVRLSRHDADFKTLADNIKSMSKLINSNSSNIIDQARSLSALVNDAISTLHKLQVLHGSLAGNILDNTDKGLLTIKRMKDKSPSTAKIAEVISDGSNEVSKNLSEIIVSLQFHDISRQRIDHAIGEFKESCTILDSEGGAKPGPSPQESSESFLKVFSKLHYLRADLKSVRDEMKNAVEGIIGNLMGIARNVVGLSTEMGDIAGAVSEDYSSFWSEMEEVMLSFTVSIKEDANTSGKLSELMNSVASTVSNMSAFVSDIKEIGSDIKLIAFNARIKAAHVGKKGASVGLIAEKIQGLSAEADEKTASILDNLNRISEYAKELSAYEDSGTKIEDVELGDVVGSLVDILNPLDMVDKSIVSNLERIDKDNGVLKVAINNSVAAITVHDEVSDVICSVLSELEEIEKKYHPLLPEGEMPGGSDELKDEGRNENWRDADRGPDNNVELF